MQFDSDFSQRHTIGTRTPQQIEGNEPGAATPPKPARDFKRTVLIFGLGALSWVATYVGMLELIEANMGDLPLVHRVIIGFSVAMLMTMIIWLLDQLFKPHTFITKVFYAGGYVFLSLISIGFGFGFYWKVLESRGEASRSAESAVTQVQTSLNAASTRLEQLRATLVQLTQVSNEKAELERTKGTSCPNSRPGDGPRRKMREEDAQRFTFASKFVDGRVGAVKGEMAALDGDLAKVVTGDISTIDIKTGTRNEFLRGLSRKLDMTVSGFNAFRTDPQLKQMRADLAERAEKTTFGDPKGGLVSCPDPQLQTALRGVVKAIEQLPELEKPQIAAVEGSEATIEAFRRLTTTFYGLLSFKLPPSAEELRELQKKAVQSVEAPQPKPAWQSTEGGLSKRDYVPLAVALFVDLCLFLVSMVSRPASRLAGLMPKMKAAEQGPVIQILSRFNDIHKDRQIRENFEIFRHVVFDMHGDYYVAVPLDAPPRLNPQEREALRTEAQLLANLFASFEKERIFKRSMLPLTSTVQKRLKRQGSKFAGSEAFRVYKFTDGAWSDIILGAVMGAARRAEDERRKNPNYVMRTVSPASHREPQPAHVAYAQASAQLPGQAAYPVAHTQGPRENGAAPSAARTPTGWPAAGTGHPAAARAPATHPAATQSVRPAPAPAQADPGAAPPPSGEHVNRFGPYARFTQNRAAQAQTSRPVPPRDPMAPQSPRVPRSPPPALPEAEVTVKAANNNTVPATADAPEDEAQATASATSRDTGVVVPLQPRQTAAPDTAQTTANPATGDGGPAQAAKDQTLAPAAGKVDVTLSRETATFSVPVGDAATPGSLKAAIAKAARFVKGEKPAAPGAQNAPPASYELVPLEDLADLDDPASSVSVEEDKLSPSDIALIGRMAPPAAE